MPEENSSSGGVAPDKQPPEVIAADIQALYDQLEPQQKRWFVEQLRRGERGESTFLDDPDQNSFEAWIRQPQLMPVEPSAPVVRVPDTFGLEDNLNELRSRLSAVELFVQHACTDRNVGAGIAYIVGDVVDVLKDVSDTLGDMRREGGAA